jgi:hypothetical protein
MWLFIKLFFFGHFSPLTNVNGDGYFGEHHRNGDQSLAVL